MTTCLVCGTSFTDLRHQNRKYCSKPCQYEARRRNETRTCVVCAASFVVRPSSRALCCSTHCAGVYRGQTKKDPSKRSAFTCKACGNAFEDWAYRNTQFCSRSCQARYFHKGRSRPYQRRPENFVTVCCEQCSREVVVHKCMVEIRNRRFCSVACRARWVSENVVGFNHHAYKGGTEFPDRGLNWSGQRKKAFRRDGGKCRICGRKPRKGEKRIIDVHHIRPYREFKGDYLAANNLLNLITLCRPCHTQVEKGTVADTARVATLIEQITRTAERMTRMRNDTAITAAEVKLISARLADVVTRYIPDPVEQQRFMAEVFSIGIGG